MVVAFYRVASAASEEYPATSIQNLARYELSAM